MKGGTTLRQWEWLHLRHAFDSILRYVLWQPVAAPDAIPMTSDANVQLDPTQRWIIGHHIFAALTQGLIFALHQLKHTLVTGDDPQATEALELSTSLFNGTAAAFQFATDFSAATYDETVLPTMMPPYMPPGLSGVLSPDHQYFIRVLTALKPHFHEIADSLRPVYTRFAQAFQLVYDSHKQVCAEFGGNKRPSLLGRAPSAEPAVEELEELKFARMKLVPR